MEGGTGARQGVGRPEPEALEQQEEAELSLTCREGGKGRDEAARSFRQHLVASAIFLRPMRGFEDLSRGETSTPDLRADLFYRVVKKDWTPEPERSSP